MDEGQRLIARPRTCMTGLPSEDENHDTVCVFFFFFIFNFSVLLFPRYALQQ